MSLNSEALHSDMLMKLLVYLILHKSQPLSVEVLSEALWNEGETDNPAGALKNLMYRLRTILNKTFGKQEYIITSRGIYSWNLEIPVQLDVEEFEKLISKAKKEKNSDKRRGYLEKAIILYQGDFMSRILDRHWVMTLSTYYHSTLIVAIKDLAELYMQDERYGDVENLCMYGLKQDPVDEWTHCMLITSLLKQNQNKLAIKHYHEAVKIMKEELGISNSPQLEAIHKQLMVTNKGSEAEKIQSVHEDVVEKGIPDGAYICGYPVFCEVYRIEARRISRLGEAEYLVLFTLQLKERNISADQQKMGKFILEKAMQQLSDILVHSLRGGDVAARYSDSQFVVLLPTCTYESCQLVSKRVLDRFYSTEKSKRVTISVDFEEVADSNAFIN